MCRRCCRSRTRIGMTAEERKAADALRQRKNRERLKEENQKSIRCHLSAGVLEALQLLAPLYGVQSRVASSGGLGPPQVGGFLGTLLEDIFRGPARASALWRALELHWAESPSSTTVQSPTSAADATRSEAATPSQTRAATPSSTPSQGVSSIPPFPSCSRSPSLEPVGIMAPEACTPSNFSSATNTHPPNTPSQQSTRPAFRPPVYHPNQREHEFRAECGGASGARDDGESDLGVEMQEGSQRSEVSFLHVSRAYQLAEWCATHGARAEQWKQAAINGGGNAW
jgi:hypothetical protein